MKKFTLVLGLFLGLAGATSAQAYYGQSYSSCYATTACNTVCSGPYGFYPCQVPIYCQTWAFGIPPYNGSACSYEWVPGAYVRCTGMTAAGFWDVLTVWCQ